MVETLITDRSEYNVWEWKSGGLFTVLICLDTKSKKVRAMKIPKWEFAFNKDLIDVFMEEARSWIRMVTNLPARYNTNVVAASGIEFEVYTGLPIVNIEYVHGSNLAEYIEIFVKKNESRTQRMLEGSISFTDKVGLFLQIAAGMSTILRGFPEYVHCDIKPSNIFVKWLRWVNEEMGLSSTLPSDMHLAVIGDIGLGRIRTIHENRILKKSEPENAYIKTIKNYTLKNVYTAPECKVDRNCYSTRSDVFALAMVMTEVFLAPFVSPERLQKELLRLSKGLEATEKIIRQFDAKFDERMDELLTKCLMKNPEQRIQNMKEVENMITIMFSSEIENRLNISFRDERDLNTMAESAFRIGDYETAEKLFDELIKESDDPETKAMNIANKAALYLNIDRIEEAKKLIGKAIKVCDKMFYVWHVKGHYYHKIGEYNKAIENYKKCIELNPEWESSHIEMEECKRKLNV